MGTCRGGIKLKKNKVDIDRDIWKEFHNVAGGDNKTAVSIINQVLRGYIMWQAMKLDFKEEKDLGIKRIET